MFLLGVFSPILNITDNKKFNGLKYKQKLFIVITFKVTILNILLLLLFILHFYVCNYFKLWVKLKRT